MSINKRGSVLIAILLATVAHTGMAGDAIVPWPPVTQDRYAPHNWPVPHPAPAVDLNEIPSGKVFRALNERERYAVQRSLARVGYYAGPIDGVWGPGTWAGTAAYADRVGIRNLLDDVHGSLRVFQHITN